MKQSFFTLCIMFVVMCSLAQDKQEKAAENLFNSNWRNEQTGD